LSDPTNGAQRASGHRSLRLTVIVLAALLAVGGLAATPGSAAASDGAAPKVVIIVGPMGSRTASYRDQADRLAAAARAYGANVVRIYSPRATWTRVKRYAQGAKLLIYLGHGNGWPSPYAPYQPYTKNGLGLNASYTGSNSNLRYFGEHYLRTYLRLHPNAVVVLNHLCYASGNSEPGRADPGKTTAVRRVDNYGAGFLRTGARAVFAESRGSVEYIIHELFTGEQTMEWILRSGPNTTGIYSFGFSSTRTPGMQGILDPSAPGKYYRSVTGILGLTATTWRAS
jgi:hypothetical protein